MTEQQYLDCVQRLEEFYEPAEAAKWMRSPHPLLNGRRPVRSTYEEVLAVINQLESGAEAS